VNELKELLGEEASEGKFGTVITKFTEITEIVESALAACGEISSIVENLLATLEGGTADKAQLKEQLAKLKQIEKNVSEIVGQVKGMLTGDEKSKVKGETNERTKEDKIITKTIKTWTLRSHHLGGAAVVAKNEQNQPFCCNS